jgi:hypothetical protein
MEREPVVLAGRDVLGLGFAVTPCLGVLINSWGTTADVGPADVPLNHDARLDVFALPNALSADVLEGACADAKALDSVKGSRSIKTALRGVRP